MKAENNQVNKFGKRVTAFETLSEPVDLKVHTKCPSKWTLIDGETGEIYVGIPARFEGDNGWMKIGKAGVPFGEQPAT